MLPGLAKRVADNVMPDVEERISKTVRDVLGTDDPKKAEKLIEDPQVASELRVRLAQIEAEAEVRQAEIDQKRREAEIEAFREQIRDIQSARTMQVDLAKLESPLQWAPAWVSIVVVVGFFLALVGLIFLYRRPPETEPDAVVVQTLNILIGALTAGFATVISYWLGSSQGSRDKDVASAKTQSIVADLQRASANSAERLVQEQARQTAAIIEKVSQPQPAPAPTVIVPAAVPGAAVPAQKDARQFGYCLDLILKHEGGFVDHPEDPGGATNMGITLKTLSAWRGENCSAADVRNLKKEEAQEIYRANYWNALNCDNLPPGVDLVTFDFGVNAGVSRAARLLQEVVYVEKDGEIGAITVGAVSRLNDPAFIIQKFTEARMKYYKSLTKLWPTFGRGWTRRTEETERAAMAMT